MVKEVVQIWQYNKSVVVTAASIFQTWRQTLDLEKRDTPTKLLACHMGMQANL